MRVRDREEVVIVGGGPAGAAAACLFAVRGRSPLVLERESGPRHKICGEFISIEAQGYLETLGLDPGAMGGVMIDKVRLAFGNSVVEAHLPFRGIGLTRQALDEAILRKAEASGARVRRGVTVRGIVPRGTGLDVRQRDGRDLCASKVFLATGKHDLHGLSRSSGTSGDDLIGFKAYWEVAASRRVALERAVEVILFNGGYAGLQCVESGIVNLCLLVRRSLFKSVGANWNNLLNHLVHESSHLRQRLDGAVPLLERPLTIANVPYGFVHRPHPAEPQGLFRLGDQMGVIPSFCGDGIAIALHTAHLAVNHAERRDGALSYHARARADIRKPIGLASGLYDLSCLRLGRRALVAACQLYPGILGRVARSTRIRTPFGSATAAPG